MPDTDADADTNADADILRFRNLYDGPDGQPIPPSLTGTLPARRRYCALWLDEDDVGAMYVEEPTKCGRVRCGFRRPRVGGVGVLCAAV